MVRELDLIEQFRDMSLVCEVTSNSVRLGMLKLSSGFLDDIIKGHKLDINLVDRLSSFGQEEDEDFRVDENDVLKFQNKLCVPDVPELKRMILEESHRSNLSIHPRATKMYQDLKKMFWWSGMKREIS
ncbi:uncharacterized protein LOC127090466 [Lathyrus oleraceus]|uniref:uncharacterized protein LOC127090466 n=1 Tax=Pisum sativum TaxID=3888 RepID=UPI0021CFA605|nr:uncharacterized protein LOC127090466 [Pisum sativum]